MRVIPKNENEIKKSKKLVTNTSTTIIIDREGYKKPIDGIPATDIASGVIPTNISSLNNDVGYLTEHLDISNKEDISNKVTSLSTQSTDTQYPSAKAVFDGLSAKADAMDVMFPNFNNLTPKKVFEYDVSDSAFHPLFSRANTGISTLMSEVNDIIKFRVTVTGTNIYAVVDVIVRLHSSLATPSVMAWNNTYSITATTTGITYLRALYPKALNNGYDWLVEFSCYNATTRHIKVEVFEDTENITWIEEKVASTYNSTYQAGANIYIYVYRGLNANNNWRLADAFCNSANSAAFISNYLPTWCAGTPPVAGEALANNQLAIMSNHKVYKATNKAIPIDCGCGVMIMGTTYAQDAAISYPYIRQKVSWTALTGDPLLTYDTFTKGEQVYLRCTLGEDGKIYPDGHLSNVMINGYTWVHIGTAASATAINLDTCGKPFITLDGNGYCTHVNGHPVGNPQVTGDAAVGMWLERTSVGSNTGKGKLKKISGRSLVWNQQISYSNLVERTAVYGLTRTKVNGTIGIFFGGTCNTTTSFDAVTGLTALANHKYLIRAINIPAACSLAGTMTYGVVKGRDYCFFTRTSTANNLVVSLSIPSGTKMDVTIYFGVYDLTRMFGTGCEPSIYDFLKMFPLDYYDYDTGRMIHGAVTGYKTTDVENAQLSNLPVSVTTLTGKPAGSNTSEMMFPDGLRGVGDVKDEIDFVTGKAIKRVGVVDLGSLTWSYIISNGKGVFIGNLPANTEANALNALCLKYDSADVGNAGAKDKSVYLRTGTNRGVGVKDSAFTDPTAFKADNDGVMLFYALPTPIEYTLDTIPPTEIDVVKGGKEMWLPVHTSTPAIAPVDGKVQYGGNLVDMMKLLERRISILEEQL